jgi:hypothetical protein
MIGATGDVELAMHQPDQMVSERLKQWPAIEETETA